ncbi:hypothetical protein ACELLULO517_15880 [Acidisoma cellulosilytica]|uniref:Uncharacterized protein n=1 Tax=Acidisoma cellulosilyticum TaxID=2802395 RepID=A0A963Z2N0_9PROT|nr:hypothetical protein [Acidisoma cellulosilyticum]MCB8881728.1 hypothetical protein [Acidisoma cellulosilyticum]
MKSMLTTDEAVARILAEIPGLKELRGTFKSYPGPDNKMKFSVKFSYIDKDFEVTGHLQRLRDVDERMISQIRAMAHAKAAET